MPSLPLAATLLREVTFHIIHTLQRRLYMHDLMVTEKEIDNTFYSAEDQVIIHKAGKLTGRNIISPSITIQFRHPTRENASIPITLHGTFIASNARIYGESVVRDDPEARRTFEAIREYAYKQWRLKVEHVYVENILSCIFGVYVTNSLRRYRRVFWREPDNCIINSTGGLYAMWPGIAPLFENKGPEFMSKAARSVGKVSPRWDANCKQAAARVEQLFAYASTLPANDTRTVMARSAIVEPTPNDIPPWPPQ